MLYYCVYFVAALFLHLFYVSFIFHLFTFNTSPSPLSFMIGYYVLSFYVIIKKFRLSLLQQCKFWHLTFWSKTPRNPDPDCHFLFKLVFILLFPTNFVPISSQCPLLFFSCLKFGLCSPLLLLRCAMFSKICSSFISQFLWTSSHLFFHHHPVLILWGLLRRSPMIYLLLLLRMKTMKKTKLLQGVLHLHLITSLIQCVRLGSTSSTAFLYLCVPLSCAFFISSSHCYNF